MSKDVFSTVSFYLDSQLGGLVVRDSALNSGLIWNPVFPA